MDYTGWFLSFPPHFSSHHFFYLRILSSEIYSTCIEQGVSSTNLKHATRSLYLVEQKWFEFGEASSQVVDSALASSVAHDVCGGIVGRKGTNGREKKR